MLKVLLQTLLGLILSFAGLFITFNFIQNIVDGVSIWLLLVALPMIVSGVMLLLRAGKSDATVMKKVAVRPLGAPPVKEGLEDTLKKNAALTEQFGKTNEARNRLKMMEISAEAQTKG